MTQTGWWAKQFLEFSVDVPMPEINVGGAERYPASFTVALDNPTLSFDSEVREFGEFSVSGLNPQINLEITRVERSFSVSCPDPRMDFLSGERYDVECEIPCDTAALSFVGRERYPREFSVVADPAFNMLGKSIQRASFGINCPTPTLPMRVREYHAPEEFVFTSSNLSWQLPDWCDAYDMIALGAGGGGMNGSGGYSNGRGGGNGTFGGRTIIRGVDVPWENRAHAITVGNGGGNNQAGGGTSLGPIGIAGQGAGGAAGAAGGSAAQGSFAVGCFTFNGRQYCGGIREIPANGANYSGWSGCGDGNLGGPGMGGCGGRGALIGGDNGGGGCRGQAWIYCYQLRPTPIRPGETLPGNGGGATPSGAIPTLYIPYRSGVQSISGILAGNFVILASGGNASSPWAAIDAARNVYVTNVWSTVGAQRITQITPTGVISHIAPGTLVGAVKGIAWLASNNAVLVVEGQNRDVFAITAGIAVPVGFTGLVVPVDVAVDSLGNIYVTDTNRAAGTRIVKKTGVMGAQTDVTYSGISSPTGITFDSNNVMYVTDAVVGKAYKIESNGVATDLGFTNVNQGGIAVGGNMVYVLDTAGNIVSRTVGGQEVSSIAMPMDGGNNSRIAGLAAGAPFIT